MLAKDGSLFSSMFELPQGKHEVEGASDDSPIWLQGESVAEFENFLWVLYALYVLLPILTSISYDPMLHSS